MMEQKYDKKKDIMSSYNCNVSENLHSCDTSASTTNEWSSLSVMMSSSLRKPSSIRRQGFSPLRTYNVLYS